MADKNEKNTGDEAQIEEGTLKEILNKDRSQMELMRFMRYSVLAILVLSAIRPVIKTAERWDVRSEIQKRNDNVVTDSTTGNMLCGVSEDSVPLDELKDYEICGKKFQASTDIGEIAVQVDQQMRADYEKYKRGEGDPIWRAKYWAYVKKSGGEENVKCLKVNYGFRTNVEQYRIFLDSLNEDGKNAWKNQLPIIPEVHQTFRAAAPCHSTHERGKGLDVDNWGAAEPYFWKHEIPGGAHGLYKDPWHFSKGEYKRGNMVDAGKQWTWWGVCKKARMCRKH